MKVLVAMDSFKGCLTAKEAGEAVAVGVRRAMSYACCLVLPVADGGEGTVEALVSAGGGCIKEVTASDPLGRPVRASYGLLREKATAVIEMSAAAGLPLLSSEERNPLHTTTFGVGELMLDAIREGCRRFIVGIGGSATNDGGVGMLQALGARFLDNRGREVARGASGLAEIASVDLTDMHPALRECTFRVACDVTNPLCGANGCSAVFAPQKGATADMIPVLDAAMANFAAVTVRQNPKADPNFPGAGAAGGLGFGLLSYLNAALSSGIALVMEETGLADLIAESDVVVTGEGRLDGQSVMGKTPVGVARLAKQYGKPVIALSGCVGDGAHICNHHGIDAFFPVLRAPCTLEEAMRADTTARNLTETAEQVFRLAAAFR